MPDLITRLFRKGKNGAEGAASEVPRMIRNGVRIDDSFAEAFGMSASGVIITAPTLKWALHSANAMTGFATSVIGCGCEAGIDRELSPDETPDGRPGVRALLFGFSPGDVEARLNDRVGMCVLTSPGSACYAGMEGGTPVKLGANMRYFADGHQISKVIGGKRYWRMPVMEGEFICEDTTGSTTEAVGGGNLLIMGRTIAETLAATEVAVEAMKKVPGVIMPFPGGVVRSGSKVGSVYKSMSASTNDAYCPTLRGKVNTALDPDIGAVEEIVIDGLTSDAVAKATRAGLAALIGIGSKGGVLRIGAGNYGGKLGQHHYHLKDLLP